MTSAQRIEFQKEQNHSGRAQLASNPKLVPIDQRFEAIAQVVLNTTGFVPGGGCLGCEGWVGGCM